MTWDDDMDLDEWAERSRARRRRSAWILIGAVAAVLAMVAGFLVVDRDGVAPDDGSGPPVATVSTPTPA